MSSSSNKQLQESESSRITDRETEKVRSHECELDLNLHAQAAPSTAAIAIQRVLGFFIFVFGFLVTAILPSKTREILELAGIVIPDLINHYLVFAFVKGAIGFGILLVGVRLILRARKLARLRAADAVMNLPESFVLYLRSFVEDDPMSAPMASGKYLFPATAEEQLATAVQDIGPLLAIGRPGEKLPEVGALRLYVDDANWQPTVRALMARAQLTLFLAGSSDGFWWELQHAVRNLEPTKFVVLLPFDKQDYVAFREEAMQRLALKLPDVRRISRLEGNIRAVLYFDAAVKPHLYSSYQMRARDALRLGHFSISKGMASYLRVLLRPAYENLGIKWLPMPTPWGSLLIFLFGISAIGASLFAWTQGWLDEPTTAHVVEHKIQQTISADPNVGPKLPRMSRRERTALIGRLAKSGLGHLEEETLVHRASLFEKLLRAADTNTCARMMHGGASSAEVVAVLKKLSIPDQSAYWNIMLVAIQAGLTLEDGRSPPEATTDTALAQVFEGMETTDVQRLSNALSTPQMSSPAEVCWAGRKLYERVNSLSEPHRGSLARALIAP